jgi:hypothetical protein
MLSDSMIRKYGKMIKNVEYNNDKYNDNQKSILNTYHLKLCNLRSYYNRCIRNIRGC